MTLARQRADLIALRAVSLREVGSRALADELPCDQEAAVVSQSIRD